MRNLPATVRHLPAAPTEEPEGSRDLHMNYAQLLAYTVSAQSCTAVVGRGGGKSDGILAPRLHEMVTNMLRSSLVMLGTTYIQLLDRTIPALMNGFQRLGYQRDVDFWVKRFPDAKANLKLPWNCPLSPEHSIFVRSGGSCSVVRLVSQDRPGTANGLSVDGLIGDEVKFLDKQKLDEDVRPINRGGVERYGHYAGHHGEWFTTDMPTSKSAQWVFDAEKEALKPHNQRNIELILAVQLEIYREKQKPLNPSRLKRIAKYESYLSELRRGLTHFVEASSFVNVHVLGLSYFKQMYRTMSPLKFSSSILNKRKLGVENGFYADLDPAKHYYDAVNYAHVDSLDYNKNQTRDWRKDDDLDTSQPLTLTFDYGSWFNCMWVSQRLSKFHLKNQSGHDEVRYLQHFYAPSPAKINDIVEQFCAYYRTYLNRDVTFVYDHTAVPTDGKSEYTYADLIIKALKKNGWRVKAKYIGQAWSHKRRYEAWGVALKETDDRVARQRFNRENVRVGFEAMCGAGTKDGRLGTEKDKTDEKNEHIDQSTTTHLTDAADTAFVWHTFIVSGQSDLIGVLMK